MHFGIDWKSNPCQFKSAACSLSRAPFYRCARLWHVLRTRGLPLIVNPHPVIYHYCNFHSTANSKHYYYWHDSRQRTTYNNVNKHKQKKKNEERLTDIKMQTENTEHFQCKSISESTSICIYDEYIIRFTVYIYHIMCCYCCLLYDGTIRWRVRGRKRERERIGHWCWP